MSWLTKSRYGEVSHPQGTDATSDLRDESCSKANFVQVGEGNLIAKFRGPNEQGFYSREGKESLTFKLANKNYPRSCKVNMP
ncbi:hypothetical protein Mapa_004527 [Marchantia paleacea]|nr:hypothetical protein Mapa_004527 [Marchantia paleacea]